MTKGSSYEALNSMKDNVCTERYFAWFENFEQIVSDNRPHFVSCGFFIVHQLQ